MFFSCYNLNFTLSAAAREIKRHINHSTAAKIFLDSKLKIKNPAVVSGFKGTGVGGQESGVRCQLKTLTPDSQFLVPTCNGVALGGKVFIHRLGDDFGVLDGEHDIFCADNNVAA